MGRIGLNNPVPDSLLFDKIVVETSHGSDKIIWTKKDITHPFGWSALVPVNDAYTLTWENFPHMTNISYSLSAWNLEDDGNYVIISHKMNQRPDSFQVLPSDPMLSINDSLQQMPDANSNNGEWYWDDDNNIMSYILSSKSAADERGVGVTSFDQSSPLSDERRAKPNVHRCFFEGCIKPPPATLPPSIDGLPEVYYNYSVDADWTR